MAGKIGLYGKMKREGFVSLGKGNFIDKHSFEKIAQKQGYTKKEQYKQEKWSKKISGKLKNTKKKVTIAGHDYGSGTNRPEERTLYVDEKGDEYVEFDGNWFRYPNEIEHY
jgi:hypothetical protein